MNLEPTVYIYGQRLSNAQAMAVRVARSGHPAGTVADADVPTLVQVLLCFENDLATEGLGDDEHGRTMVRLYTENSRAVRSLVDRLAPKS